MMLVLAFIDAAVYRLPHRLTAAAALGWIALVAPTGASAITWWSAFGAAGGLVAFYGLFHLATPSGLGLGDVALVVPAGLALGWLDWRYAITALLLAHSSAALTVVTRRVRGTGGHTLPLGVYLAVASGVTVMAALAT
jgi:leader peptidase (prepilin peptidase)/N-methyltransferase